MSILAAIILGLIQGATEFLPVSSSGHLALAQFFLGAEEPNRLFDIVLHVGTLVAIVAFYRKEIWEILRDIKDAIVEKDFNKWGVKLSAIVIIASFPTAILGLAIEKYLPKDINTLAYLVCGLLILNGFILVLNKFAPNPEVEEEKTLMRFPFWKAILLGIAQGFAVFPGISRSGTTITAALFFGISRTEAAMLSFLLSIPAILGALILKFDMAMFAGNDSATPFLLGALIAAVSGYIFLTALVALLKKAKFHYFAWYCWILAGVCLTFLFLR